MNKAFRIGWSVVKESMDEMIDRLMREQDMIPADTCQICGKDMNEKKNLSPKQHEAMLHTGAFPDVCIHCQLEHGISGDF